MTLRFALLGGSTYMQLSSRMSRNLAGSFLENFIIRARSCRNIHTTLIRRDRSFTNLLADDNPPAVQVASISESGIQLADGLIIPGACIFLEGKVFLWDVPEINLKSKVTAERWHGWDEDRFELLDVVTPRPEILLLGTGKTLIMPPPFLRPYLSKHGIQLDVMDTRNACSTYNILAEEGRRVAAALMPLTPYSWPKSSIPAPGP
ncbi:NADH dehydrogenase 1 alpha subcomplex assembly factor 3 [Gymnopilus junonius]|uniref:NADH dehydrogenase [ubiquinone] 1 alpha subcomplex assembly factor 3 n=1 Tax=Gymnopilus junonius TaxID=109634 RepID=A0A9P5TIY3_GYMJU|nr:NADH dehydrogenase 1 alpha subcomplex assembly factor 3 [Gymnopilus junonius]